MVNDGEGTDSRFVNDSALGELGCQDTYHFSCAQWGAAQSLSPLAVSTVLPPCHKGPKSET